MVVCIVCAFSCGLIPCQCHESRRTIAPRIPHLLGRIFPTYFHFGCCSCEKFHDRYDLGEELGRGSSGITRICTEKSTGEKLACKSIFKSKNQQEAEIMRQVSGHPNIINLREAYYCSKISHLVMELCLEGSLSRDRTRDRILHNEVQAASLCKGLMEAVQFCHSKGIVHRDITLANVLISESLEPKLADFGLATRLAPGERLSKLVGTTYFVAPEVLKGDYGYEVDVWSCGVVLYAVLSGGEFPFLGKTTRDTFSAILGSPIAFKSAYWRQASPLAKNLILGMLCREVEDRLTPWQVLNHEWIVQYTGKEASKFLNDAGTIYMLSDQDNSYSDSFILLNRVVSPALGLGHDMVTMLKLMLAMFL